MNIWGRVEIWLEVIFFASTLYVGDQLHARTVFSGGKSPVSIGYEAV
jgi:hypothetical protein